MSRLAKKPIVVPEKTEVSVSGNSIRVKGPLGELARPFRNIITIEAVGQEVTVKPKGASTDARALTGTFVSHIKNMITGVNRAFEKKLVIEGIGYKAEVKGDTLHLNLGFSHPIDVSLPKGIKAASEKGVVTIMGIDKELVGQLAAIVRSYRKPEPYKGKGIRYEKEVIRRKQGKKTV